MVSTSPEVVQRSVRSVDGTVIGYTVHGAPHPGRPGLILIQGAMATAAAYTNIAQLLSTRFTVYTPDRRGRGMSPKPYDATHHIGRDVEDVDAVLAETGATLVFGLSSGALITLEAARLLDRVTQAAVFEPPFYPPYPATPDDSDDHLSDLRPFSHEEARRFDAEVERGDLSSARFTALIVSQTAPEPFFRLPRPVASLLASVLLTVYAYWDPASAASKRPLIPAARYDFNVAGGMDGKMATLSALHKPVLLISGTRSPRFLSQAVRKLKSTLPRARLVELEGLGHDGPWNSGKPEVVAAALKEFFGAEADATGAADSSAR